MSPYGCSSGYCSLYSFGLSYSIPYKRMKPTDRIQTEIEGLESLLTVAIRINQPKYVRELRKDIEGLGRELRIQRVIAQKSIKENVV
jgi:hypothetical protein